MPQLNYATEVFVTGAYTVPLPVLYGHTAYYDGSTPERTTKPCPDCLAPADAQLGHGGACVALELTLRGRSPRIAKRR